MSDEQDTHVPPAVAERVIPPDMMPGRNGGLLRAGGGNPKRNGGRHPAIIRDGLRKNLLKSEKKMASTVHQIEQLIKRRKRTLGRDYARLLDDQERLFNAEMRLAEFRAKYGLGTTITETDTGGKDVIRVIREPVHRASDN